MHWVLRHNYANLNDDDKVRLRHLFQYSPRLHQAYTLREELTVIHQYIVNREKHLNSQITINTS
jgi:hypothetical protein